jgi:hypothetical protein
VSTNRLALSAWVAVVGLLTAYALQDALCENHAPDLFIYRAGADRGLRGESPYDGGWLQPLVAAQYPDDGYLRDNCGFFLPPQAVLVFAPFAAVPFLVAKVLWALLTGACVAAALLVLRTFAPRPQTGVGAPFVLAFNYLTFKVIELGQTGLLIVGCVAAGQWCFERRRPVLGTLLWSVAFVKPHLALPLIPLAWYLGGWRRAAALVAMVAALNAAGAVVVSGTPLMLRDYVASVGAAHKAVLFNRVEDNPEITSWNRLLYTLSEPVAGRRLLVELTATLTFAGYAVWFALAAARCCFARARPSAAWALAAAAVGALLCAQAMPYDLVLLALVVPWVRELFVSGRWGRGWLGVAFLALELVPFDWFLSLGVLTHRPLGVALMAVLVLAGPVNADARG